MTSRPGAERGIDDYFRRIVEKLVETRAAEQSERYRRHHRLLSYHGLVTPVTTAFGNWLGSASIISLTG